MGRFLIAVFDEWVRHDVEHVFVQMFDAALASWVGVPPALCIFSETCGNALALEHNGDLYSCDHFVEPDYLLGNIQQERMIDLVPPRSSGSSATPSATRFRAIVASVRCYLPVTASAQSTASSKRQMASLG